MNATIEIEQNETKVREATGDACCGTTEFLHRWFCMEAPHDLCEEF